MEYKLHGRRIRTCKYCGCKFQIFEYDGQHFDYVYCPNCGKEIARYCYIRVPDCIGYHYTREEIYTD